MLALLIKNHHVYCSLQSYSLDSPDLLTFALMKKTGGITVTATLLSFSRSSMF